VVQNKRFSDLCNDINRRPDGIVRRVDRIEAKLAEHAERISRLEVVRG
jgi:hypothetical protein